MGRKMHVYPEIKGWWRMRWGVEQSCAGLGFIPSVLHRITSCKPTVE